MHRLMVMMVMMTNTRNGSVKVSKCDITYYQLFSRPLLYRCTFTELCCISSPFSTVLHTWSDCVTMSSCRGGITRRWSRWTATSIKTWWTNTEREDSHWWLSSTRGRYDPRTFWINVFPLFNHVPKRPSSLIINNLKLVCNATGTK